jgi:hypothetical protein
VEGAPAREGAKIYSAEDGKMDLSSATPIGVVTSGTFSPMYVSLHAIDTLLSLPLVYVFLVMQPQGPHCDGLCPNVIF